MMELDSFCHCMCKIDLFFPVDGISWRRDQSIIHEGNIPHGHTNVNPRLEVFGRINWEAREDVE